MVENNLFGFLSPQGVFSTAQMQSNFRLKAKIVMQSQLLVGLRRFPSWRKGEPGEAERQSSPS